MNPKTRRARQRSLFESNPWGLSPAVERALDAVVQTGSNKAAGVLLGLDHKTIGDHTKTAKRVIVAKGISGTRLQALLAWDRWRQRQKAAAEQQQ